jgi:hypothetical protein
LLKHFEKRSKLTLKVASSLFLFSLLLSFFHSISHSFVEQIG